MYSLKLLLLSLLVAGYSEEKIVDNSKNISIIPKNSITLHGWIPFWAKASGTIDILNNKDMFSSISPFSMEVSKGGFVFNRFENDNVYSKIINLDRKYKVVPTIAWFDADEIEEVLSSETLRKFHINEILRIINNNKYDGIDIDYEGKYLKTKNSYSLFIKELGESLHKSKLLLYCTVEARTPSEDRFYGAPRISMHSSDYKELNKYCDSVRIMSYDQRDGDRTLVVENGNSFYRPVADHNWVEKTIKEAIYEIDRRKIVVGIPTYGNVYKLATSSVNNYYSYVGAINYNYAVLRAKENNVSPIRNKAGELQFSYKKDDITYYVTFSDAVSIKKKLLLAEKYGLSGVALFKIDGGADKDVWAELDSKIKRP